MLQNIRAYVDEKNHSFGFAKQEYKLETHFFCLTKCYNKFLLRLSQCCVPE